MRKEILIYGLPKGEIRDYMEDLLACFPVTDSAASNIEKVKAAASAQGFHSFRVTGFVPGTKPNFAKAVNVKLYEAIPALQYLQQLNRTIKEAQK